MTQTQRDRDSVCVERVGKMFTVSVVNSTLSISFEISSRQVKLKHQEQSVCERFSELTV